MRLKSIVTTAAATALLVPAAAFAGGPPAHPAHPAHPSHPSSSDNPGTSHRAQPHNDATPGPNASAHAKRKAYGRYCANQSRKHVKGQKGTPFSQCVTAMAKAANGVEANGTDGSTDTTVSPRAACKSLSHKHVKGEKGTPFSQCVRAAAHLQKDQQDQDQQGADQQDQDQQQPATTGDDSGDAGS